jgi:hypothetical protein
MLKMKTMGVMKADSYRKEKRDGERKGGRE